MNEQWAFEVGTKTSQVGGIKEISVKKYHQKDRKKDRQELQSLCRQVREIRLLRRKTRWTINKLYSVSSSWLMDTSLCFLWTTHEVENKLLTARGKSWSNYLYEESKRNSFIHGSSCETKKKEEPTVKECLPTLSLLLFFAHLYSHL